MDISRIRRASSDVRRPDGIARHGLLMESSTTELGSLWFERLNIQRFIHVQTMDFKSLKRMVRESEIGSVLRTPDRAAVNANVVAGRIVVFTSLLVMRNAVFTWKRNVRSSICGGNLPSSAYSRSNVPIIVQASRSQSAPNGKYQCTTNRQVQHNYEGRGDIRDLGSGAIIECQPKTNYHTHFVFFAWPTLHHEGNFFIGVGERCRVLISNRVIASTCGKMLQAPDPSHEVKTAWTLGQIRTARR